MAKNVKVWDIVTLPKDLLIKDTTNTNKQSKATFKALRENIRDNGFDEPLIVVPEGNKYKVVSGNHRLDAGLAEGMKSFPAVIHDDWDAATAYMQSVRRNYSRGAIDKNAFATLTDLLETDYHLSQEDISIGMGLASETEFASLYEKQIDNPTSPSSSRSDNTAAATKIKLLDDLGMVLSHIFEKYGDTVPYSFIVFPAGNRHHVFIQSSNALKTKLQEIMGACLEKQLDITVALAGLLTIGVSYSDFLKGNKSSTNAIREIVEKITKDKDDSEFEPVELNEDE